MRPAFCPKPSMEASSIRASESTWSSIFSHRKFIDDIPADIRRKLCTEIDYTITQNEGYWQKIVGRLGFDETQSKKFLISFQMHRSPTNEMLRDCSHRMIRIRHLYNVLKEVGLVQLSQELLGAFDTEEELPAFPPYLVNYENYSFPSLSRSNYDRMSRNRMNFSAKKKNCISWMGIDTCHFSYEQIRKGTKDFSPSMELGVGAFGKVYKVILNNTLFACKVLKIDKDNALTTSIIETHRQNDDLRNELNYLAEYRHPNVIALYGWSLDGEDPCLIYDFMKNGSLQDRLQCLDGTSPLSWPLRLKVSCDAARGLQFLHTLKDKPLIHGDIKTANILLDKSFTAKLGDFGLAREMSTTTSTGSYIKLSNEHTPGTLGYLANEYISTKKLSAEVDTYAFGVVLLEVYTGRRAYERHKETPLLRDYVDDIAQESDGQEKLFYLQDPQTSKLPCELAERFINLSLKCCHEKRKKRPKMCVTLDELQSLCDNLLSIGKQAVSHPRSSSETSQNLDTLERQFHDIIQPLSSSNSNDQSSVATSQSGLFRLSGSIPPGGVSGEGAKYSSHLQYFPQAVYNQVGPAVGFHQQQQIGGFHKSSSGLDAPEDPKDQDEVGGSSATVGSVNDSDCGGGSSRVCINPVKESLLDKLKDGQTYTMIFRDQNQLRKQIRPSSQDDDDDDDAVVSSSKTPEYHP